jgi:hypothetical protein
MISMRIVSRENTLGGVETMVSAQVVVYPSGFPDDDSAGDQSVKKMAPNCREAPSKVNMAVGTHSNTPHVAGKPGELGRTGSNIDASPGIPETGNFKNDTFRIGKRMRLRAVDHLALCG